MLFVDRLDAGKALAEALKAYANTRSLIFALPRGGVVVAYEVAQKLHLPLDIVSPRKIGAPLNPELAIGAVTETGEVVFTSTLTEDISKDYIKEVVQKERKEAQRRLEQYRKGYPPRDVKNRCVILIDDGLATGSTMLAAIKTMRAEKARQIVVAIPIAPPDTLDRIKNEVDTTICLTAPSSFYAVGQFYKHFDQVTDEQVIHLLAQSQVAYHNKE